MLCDVRTSLFNMRLCVLCFMRHYDCVRFSHRGWVMGSWWLRHASKSVLHTEFVLIFRFEIKDLLHTSWGHWGFSGLSTSDPLTQVTHPGLSQNASQQQQSMGSPSLSKATKWLSLRLQWWNVWLPSSQLRLLQVVSEMYRLSVEGTPGSPL